MNRVFKDFATYVRLHDGMGKPEIRWHEMYKLFPEFEFTASPNFGNYVNFGEAYEQKVYDMIVTFQGKTCYMHYRVYGDAAENSAYVS